jgi:carbon-monoxide dehydrogenase small subunit
LAFEAIGSSVLTIEGLAPLGELDPLQCAFVATVASQCGYCTPGQIMAAKALLTRDAHPSAEETLEWMSGNICRCGCYHAIGEAIRLVIEKEVPTVVGLEWRGG